MQKLSMAKESSLVAKGTAENRTLQRNKCHTAASTMAKSTPISDDNRRKPVAMMSKEDASKLLEEDIVTEAQPNGTY